MSNKFETQSMVDSPDGVNEQKSTVKVVEENLAPEGWEDGPEQLKNLFKLVKRLGFNPDKCLYRGFDGTKTETLLQNGRENLENDEFFAMTKAAIEYQSEHGDSDQSPISYADATLDPAIAVYDASKFKLVTPSGGDDTGNTHLDSVDYVYVLRNETENFADAVLAVVKLKN